MISVIAILLVISTTEPIETVPRMAESSPIITAPLPETDAHLFPEITPKITPEISDESLSYQDPSGHDATPEPSSSPIPSFGEGAELHRNGAPASPGPSDSTTAPPANAPHFGWPMPETFQGPSSPQPPATIQPGPFQRIPPPIPPVVQSEVIVRTVYYLQTEVYGLKVALSGRPPRSWLIQRSQLLLTISADLANQCSGRPRMTALASQLNGELVGLDQAAKSGDLNAFRSHLVMLDDLLARMRLVPPP